MCGVLSVCVCVVVCVLLDVCVCLCANVIECQHGNDGGGGEECARPVGGC